MRREFTKAIKIAAFQRSAGRCEVCTAKLFPGNIEYDHRIPDALGGDPTLDNAVCLCRACHSVKTAKHDVPAIARAKRRFAMNVGATRPKSRPMPGSRASGLRKHMDGTV